MTDTTFTQQPQPHPQHQSRRRVERPVDAPFKGVCTAVAEATGTDAVLWRVLVVVLSFFGGLGVFLYVLGYVAIPEQGQERSIGDRLLHGPDRYLRRGQVLPVVILIVAAAVLLRHSNGAIALLVLAVLTLMWWRGRPDERLLIRPQSPGDSPQAAAVPAGEQSQYGQPSQYGQYGHPGQYSPPTEWTPTPPRRRRPRSPLTGLTLSLAAITGGVLALIGVSTSTSVPAEAVLASALGVVGLGLVIGSWWGRSIGLVLVALVLGLGLAGTVAARPVLDAGVGARTWHPTADPHQSFRLGVGDATLDLTRLTPQESPTINVDAKVDVGHLLVLVPSDLRVTLSARAGLGDIDVLGTDHNGRDVSTSEDLGPSGRPQVRLDLHVRTGQVEVRRG